MATRGQKVPAFNYCKNNWQLAILTEQNRQAIATWAKNWKLVATAKTRNPRPSNHRASLKFQTLFSTAPTTKKNSSEEHALCQPLVACSCLVVHRLADLQNKPSGWDDHLIMHSPIVLCFCPINPNSSLATPLQESGTGFTHTEHSCGL